MERYLSGFCRTQNAARTVLAEEDEGAWDVGCDFPCCAHCDSCTIAKELKQLQEEHDHEA